MHQGIEAMTSKWQKYVAIAVIILGGILVILELINKQITWGKSDAVSLTSACLDDLGAYAVRFPTQSEEYCDCSTQSILNSVDKADYQVLMSKSAAEQEEELLPIILECYNDYQESIYNGSKLD